MSIVRIVQVAVLYIEIIFLNFERESVREKHAEFFNALCLPVITRAFFISFIFCVLFLLLFLALFLSLFSNCGQKGILALRNVTSTSYFSPLVLHRLATKKETRESESLLALS